MGRTVRRLVGSLVLGGLLGATGGCGLARWSEERPGTFEEHFGDAKCVGDDKTRPDKPKHEYDPGVGVMDILFGG